jgi:hypothetical protein
MHIFAAIWAFANMAAAAADAVEIADMTIGLAPGDPQTHYSAAVLYDRTFLPEDQRRSLDEYERAVALSPDNYLLWLEYGKALGRSGDIDRELSALRRAQQLAPNYAAVRWALGNALVRSGDTEAGFGEIRGALAGNKTFAAPAAALAYGFFDGDLERVRAAAGDSPEMTAALALILAKEKRYNEALAFWDQLPAAGEAAYAESGQTLVAELLAGKRFSFAQQVAVAINADAAFTTGEIFDGGFERSIKLQNAPPFEWQIAPGAQPQVLQSEGQRHGGARSLVLVYSSTDGNGLREIKQLVAVRTGGKYVLHGFYRSEIKTSAPLGWHVDNASDNTAIAKADVTPNAADWKEFSVSFTVPDKTDGVVIRFGRDSCASAVCPVTGNIWFDDLALMTR